MYGLPQTGILANQLLRKRLAKHRYYKVPLTPGLWKHHIQPIQFTFIVDDFGIKYASKKNAEHPSTPSKIITKWELIGCVDCILESHLKLEWHNKDRYVNISMPGYIKKQLQKYEHI